ncbi:hypothetical protein DPMN_111560, partial [Dreissena polymorpha]
MNNQAILEGATSLTPPSIAFSSIYSQQESAGYRLANTSKGNGLLGFVRCGPINVASRVFTRNTAPPTGGHVFQRTGTTFELNQDIIKTNILTNFDIHQGIIGKNLLTKFHEDLTRKVVSRVLTRKTAPPAGGHVFQRTGTTFELLNQHIIKTNILTNFELDRGIIGTNFLSKFHEDRTRNGASRVFIRKTAPPTGGHVFQRTGTTFELNQHIIKTNILT